MDVNNYNNIKNIFFGYGLSKNDVNLLFDAYVFALMAHKSQIRKTGEPYIVHPLNVVSLLVDMNMDCETIVAGMLHDVIEDTFVQKERIVSEFGNNIANLVDGVSKLNYIDFDTKIEKDGENLKKLLLAAKDDVRIIFIKLADRIHNLITLKFLSIQQQIRKALETLEIYVPIAEIFGLNELQFKLENLSFFYLNRQFYNFIDRTIVFIINRRRQELEKLKYFLFNILKTHCFNMFKLVVVKRSLYSIYKNFRFKKLSSISVHDICFFRLILYSFDVCFDIIDLLSKRYIIFYDKSFNSVVFSNVKYNKICTTLLSPFGVPVELCIYVKRNKYIDLYYSCDVYKRAYFLKNKEIKEFFNYISSISKLGCGSVDFFNCVKTRLNRIVF